ncbi:alpha/beta hydrolase [Propionibacteriaceae bacterium Y1700]|uniref:alpha/beta hydrolase n=1 Tax=Microlunatus sp. Y1700 TaxID=3418487 RepID=UPI003DA6F3B2
MRSLLDRLTGHRVPVADAPTTAAVLPGTERWSADASEPLAGGRTAGVLVCHGFTGSVISMTPWAEHLHSLGYGVAVPRLPGHGTDWRELNRVSWTDWYACVERELIQLADNYDRVFIAGLSMGGALALRLAEEHPALVAGLALVNPAVASRDPRMALTPALRYVISSIPAIGNDIAKPGMSEGAYERTPIGGVAEMVRLQAITRADLSKVTAPLLLFRSVVDHVVDPSSAEVILREISSERATERLLHDSYHVATVDHDAETIFAESATFFGEILTAAPSAAGN